MGFHRQPQTHTLHTEASQDEAVPGNAGTQKNEGGKDEEPPSGQEEKSGKFHGRGCFAAKGDIANIAQTCFWTGTWSRKQMVSILFMKAIQTSASLSKTLVPGIRKFNFPSTPQV